MRLVSKLVPAKLRKLRKLLKSGRVLSEAYGHRLSINLNRCVDHSGNPIPWYTYPAIEYLSGLDFSKANVLEFGSGASSTWWAKRAANVLSIEHDAAWFNEISDQSIPNLTIRLLELESDYVTTGSDATIPYDVIVIDGVHRHRCAEGVRPLMAEGCLILLDNSDWYPQTARLLREHDLIQVDFHGFGPINPFTWTTSIFFSRSFKVAPSGDRLPGYSAGAIKTLAAGQ